VTFGLSIKPALAVKQVELVARKVQFMTESCHRKLTLNQISTNDNCLKQPYLAPAQIIDSWGSPLNLKYTSDKFDEFVVISVGKDKLLDTSDDVIAEAHPGLLVIKYPEYKSNFQLILYSAFSGFIVCLLIMMLVQKLKK
jgi:hypothetical protein